jgi:predicted metal-dependent phosphoesterase TrpH
MGRVGHAAWHTIELTGHLSPADRARSVYRMLPFDVPEGIARLEVSYRFSDDDPGGFMRPTGNILDIGLFDARGSEFLHAGGFRGWSGATRREFFLAPDEATPGYLPGPIPPGRWQIVLGLHNILPHGCDYYVAVRLYAGESPNLDPLVLPPWTVLRREPGWYRGDLHCHSHHSDGSGSLADLAAAARAQRLDFLAVTEHNTVSHLPHLAAHAGPDLLLIPGQEITTEHGHANAWGIRRWHEFRCECDEQMAQVVAEVRAEGALTSINHPKEDGPPWKLGGAARLDCFEVWQAPWFAFNDQSLALWDRLLREGHRLVAVGGSDQHQAPFDGQVGNLAVGKPCTWVYAEELSVAGVLAGIEAGHVFISEDSPGPRLFLTADADGDGRYEATMGDAVQAPAGAAIRLRCRVEGAAGCELRIRAMEGDRVVPIGEADFTDEWTVRIAGDTFFRAEVMHRPEPPRVTMRALSNPIYVRIRG